ncbi:MAG: RC-LH1 core complex protein PufX [Pseudomonadota bacterium]
MTNQDEGTNQMITKEPTMLSMIIVGQMAKGAAVAAFVVFGPVVFIYALYFLGTFLPPESKEADDPTPDSFSAYEQIWDGPVLSRSSFGDGTWTA